MFPSALKAATIGWLLLAIFSANAEVTFHDSRAWTRSRLVSGGQQVWSFQTSYQKISDRFSATGKPEPLGRGYARAITWGQLMAAEESPVGRADMQSYMRQQGLTDADVAATSAYDLERENVGFSVDWAYGITKRWMVGFQIPMVMRRTRVSSRVSLTPTLASAASTKGQRSMLALNDQQMREKVRSLAQNQLVNSGYDDIPDAQESWDWGDISLLSQFYLMEDADWEWSLQQLVRFPSSRNPSVSDYFQQMGDDGQTDIGLTSLFDYHVRRWTLGFRLGYVAQLPDAAKMRVSDLERDVDPKVSRDLGDWAWGAMDIDYRFNRRFTVDVEYAYLSKTSDTYEGAGRDYAALMRTTDQEVHQTRLGMLYALGERSARAGVENKWVAAIGYTYPFLGRNSSDASRTSLEIISYF